MNRFLYISLLLVTLTLGSCIREITLTPYELPDLIDAFTRKVECFDNENAMFIASDEGVLLQYGEDRVLFNANTFDELQSFNWDESEVLYSSSTEIFWVISDTTYLQIGRNTFEIHYDKTKFYAPAKSYYSHVVSPEGKLYRVGYYDDIWDPESGSFYSDYYIGIYEFVGNPNNTWIANETEMKVNSEFLAIPNSAFTSDGSMLINTNPSYIVDGVASGAISYESIEKEGVGFEFRTSFRPHASSNDVVYGLNLEPTSLTPVTSVFRAELLGSTVSAVALDGDCEIPSESQGAVKLLDWTGSTVRFYIRFFTNNLSENKDVLGYIMTYDVDGGDCSIKELKSSDELRLSESIQDLDIYGDKVFIGTRTGLLTYDLETDFIESYLTQILDQNLAQE